MAVHIHTISQLQHSLFIKQERKDPFTKQTIQAGDQVVFCAVCKTAFLVNSWETVGGKHCNQQNTLRDFPPQIESIDIRKPKNHWFARIAKFVKENFPYERLVSLKNQVAELMNNVEACKVYFIISTIFFPLTLVTIFLGVRWSLGILFLALAIVALNRHFLEDSNIEDIKVFDNTTLDFFLGKIVYFMLVCFFSLKNIFQYIKNITDDDNDFLVDLLWVLYFCLISVIILKLHFRLYIFSVFFIFVTQEFILKIPRRL